MKILIATPAYGDVVYRGFHETIANLVLAFGRAFPQIRFEQRLINVPVLATARNILASVVLNDPSYTHLLFVDADMAFSPMLIARMLAFRKPFVGSIYPQKRHFFDAFKKAETLGDWTTLQMQMVTSAYVCGSEVVHHPKAGGGEAVVVRDGFLRVTASGTGVMLLERSVLERMRDELPGMWMAEPGRQIRDWGLEEGGLFRGFDTIVNSEGYHVGEDIAFCLRWTEMGGEIWAAVDEAIVHSGLGYFRGHALIAMKSRGKPAVREFSRLSKGRSDKWWGRVLAR